MPLHVLLSQWLSLATGGLEAWKLGKDMLLVSISVFTFCLVWRQRRGTKEFAILLSLAALYATLHFVLWACNPALFRDSALLGIIYNNRLFGYLLVGLGAGLLLPLQERHMIVLARMVLCVSTAVAAFGVLQYFLPKDLMAHFGYGLDRGTLPAFFIDNKPNFPRIMSTLRDPNSLGAFLVVPVTWLTALLLQARDNRRRLLFGSALAVHVLALILTFSRGAWAAAGLALAVLLVWRYMDRMIGLLRRFWPVAAVLVVIAGTGVFVARDTYFLQSVVTHSTGTPQAEYDSNGFHWVLARRGFEGFVRYPFGHGPGTAGLASIHNPSGAFLTENYYIQIAYEVGVLGLLLFVVVNVLVYRALLQRQHVTLAVVLLASFWGYVCMNMLFHTWSNEAVATQWWLLAGLVIALPAATAKPH